ncbi:uncharacterized protein LOC135372195 [Ornithodoros turicata]|uniref:uncharacterized protein LOC135372195 n=1 Tax=Ornithodoros turicata TaxID=34597 RepID=UPI003139B376
MDADKVAPTHSATTTKKEQGHPDRDRSPRELHGASLKPMKAKRKKKRRKPDIFPAEPAGDSRSDHIASEPAVAEVPAGPPRKGVLSETPLESLAATALADTPVETPATKILAVMHAEQISANDSAEVSSRNLLFRATSVGQGQMKGDMEKVAGPVGVSSELAMDAGYVSGERNGRQGLRIITKEYMKDVKPTGQSVRNTRVCLISGIIGVILISIVVVLVLNGPPHRALVKSVGNWCTSSQSCHDAEMFLQKIVDTTFHPCTDFYSHVCSRWLKPTRFRNAYMDELLYDLMMEIYDQLEEAKDNPIHRDALQAMSVFFKSCMKFIFEKEALQHVVTEVLRVLEVDVSLWKTARTLDDVFPMIFNLGVKGCPSVFKIGYRRRPQIDVLISGGSSLSGIYDQGIDDTLKGYMADVVKISNIDAEANIKDIDGKFWKIYNQVSNSTFETIPVDKLGIGVSLDVLVRAQTEGFYGTFSNIKVKDLGIIRAALDELSHLTAQQRNSYLYLLTLSNILVHDFTFRYRDFRVGEERECLRLTSRYFSRGYFQYVINRFQSDGVKHAMTAMEVDIRESILEETRTSSWISATSMQQVIDAMNATEVWLGQGKADIPEETAFHFLNESFIWNVASLLKEHVELRTTDANDVLFSQWQYEGTVGYVKENKTIVFATAVLRPHMFYEDLAFRLNYATAGMLMAEALLQAGLERVDYPSREADTRYQNWNKIRCYKRRIEEMTGMNASDEAVRELVALELSLHGSFNINRTQGLSAEDAKESDQMFFRRFCLANCGPSSGHRRLLPGKFRCNFLLLGQSEFAKAFDCLPKSNECLVPGS